MPSDIRGQEVLEQGGNLFKKWLDKLQAFLERKFGMASHEFNSGSGRSVQFRFKNIIDVDLLVSPFWGDVNPTPFYTFLRSVPGPKRDRYEQVKQE